LSEAVFEIQKLLAAKNTDRALGLLDQLQGRFPALDYLNFMRASALVLKGDRKGATSALKKALATHPSNVEGQALLKALEGGGI
jgi:predicted negative regulator of RcsB-dependent stress response